METATATKQPASVLVERSVLPLVVKLYAQLSQKCLKELVVVFAKTLVAIPNRYVFWILLLVLLHVLQNIMIIQLMLPQNTLTPVSAISAILYVLMATFAMTDIRKGFIKKVHESEYS